MQSDTRQCQKKKRNPGKIFEEDFKRSVPKDTYYLRLHDPANSFNYNNKKRGFSLKSPFDCIVCDKGYMWCFELKSTKSTSFTFDGKTPYIKKRQIMELLKAQNAGAKAFLVLNFRKTEETYLISPDKFLQFVEHTNKKSINKNDAKHIGILLGCSKKRVHFYYDIKNILKILS